MATCKYCNAQLPEAGTRFCPNCGLPQNGAVQYSLPVHKDSSSFGWSVLGFLIPILGFILYLAWRKSRPMSSHRAGVGALFGYSVGLVLAIILRFSVFSFASLLI